MRYNWQQPDWPNFRYDLSAVEDLLFAFAEKTGHIAGLLQGLPDNAQQETILSLMVSEAVKTSEIEGEFIQRSDVMSSIRNNLGLNPAHEEVRDKKAQGVGELLFPDRLARGVFPLDFVDARGHQGVVVDVDARQG